MKRIVLAVLLLLSARAALACSCVGRPTVEQDFKFADLVFAGVVESIEDPGGDRIRALPEYEQRAAWQAAGHGWGPDRGNKVTFRVLQWWKGEDLGKSVVIWTGYGGGDCGYPVEKGQSFLVFARRTPTNLLTMSICSRTSALVCATEDVEALGDPIKQYEKFDRETLIAREQPYTPYWRPCIQNALLIGERGLSMDRHCSWSVDAVVDREGVVRDFKILGRPTIGRCPESLDAVVKERVAAWRFQPAKIDGVAVESRFKRVSMREPYTVADHEKFLQEEKERQLKMKQDQEKH